jgi:hypothetical protein
MPLPALLSLYSPLIPIVLFLLYFKSTNKTVLWVFFVYSIYAFTNDNVLIYVQTEYFSNPDLKYLKTYNRNLLYTFTIIEYLFFSAFFFSVLKSKKIKTSIVVISVLFSAFCLYFILAKAFTKFDSVQTSISGILIIIFSIFYFYEQINSPKMAFIYQDYKFWIVFGILIYMAGNLFLFSYASNLSNDQRDQYWIINFVSNIMKNILFALAIFIRAKQATEKPVLEDPFMNLI